MPQTTRPSVSFEFFPPKSESAAAQLWEAVPQLAALGPKYMTVTYGAGGSTKSWTLETAGRMVRETALPVASHLTFLTTPRAELEEYTAGLWEQGINHIVALRGDLPAGKGFADFLGEEFYSSTAEFITALRDRHDFEISVAAYPEKHPDAPSLEADIATLKEKCDAGATRAITQFFFDNDLYFDFLDKCRAAGITTPIYPGLLPIAEFSKMVSFAKRCQASVPAWLHEKFAGLEERPEDAHKIAEELLAAQARDLTERGVEHIHFYTLNKAGMTLAACEAVGYKADAA